ncbi:MAG: ABC transporter permease subunit [Candidatus Bathyarchaeia archaeon]
MQKKLLRGHFPIKVMLVRFVPLRGMRDRLLCLLPLALVLTGWEALSGSGLVSVEMVPSPSRVLLTLVTQLGSVSFVFMVLRSFCNLTLGIILALFSAAPLAICAGLRKRVDSTLTPSIMLAGSLPDLALLPLLVMWFGEGSLAAVVMAGVCAFFPIYFTLREGVRLIPPEYFQVSTVFHSGKLDFLDKLILPAIVPQAITGLRLAFDFVWEVILAIEIIAQVAGIGSFINTSVEQRSVEAAFAGIFAVGILSIIVDRCFFGFLEERVKRWA